MKSAVGHYAQIVLLLLTAPAFAQPGPTIGPDKKIIKCGQDIPDARYLREHIRELEQLPIDGVVIDLHRQVDGEKQRMFLRWWDPELIDEQLLADTVADLDATEFRRFTDNFIFVSTVSHFVRAPSWFDDDGFGKIKANMVLAARIAREGGLKGIMLDIEHYGFKVWSPWVTRWGYYDHHSQEQSQVRRGVRDRVHTWDEFAAAARRRGREITSAMCEVYPDITVLVISGLHRSMAKRIGRRTEFTGIQSSDYALLAPFGDGMLEGASPQSTIVDGCEEVYPFTLNKRFAQARHDIEAASQWSQAPDLYRRRVTTGFGLMLDYEYILYGWHTKPETFGRNHFTPTDFGNALYFAMLNSDRYVWIWNEVRGAVFWPHSRKPRSEPNVPQPYFDAIAGARQARDLGTGRDNDAARRMPVPQSATQLPNYSDEKTFAPLEDEFEIVADLPEKWLFFADEEALGFRADYTKADTDVTDWKPISIGDFMQRRGRRFRGIGWYRCSVHVPEQLKGRKVFLLFGGVSTNHVWVNGTWCPYDVKHGVLVVDFSKHVKYAVDNLVVVPIITDGRPGGIHKSVKLAISRPEP